MKKSGGFPVALLVLAIGCGGEERPSLPADSLDSASAAAANPSPATELTDDEAAPPVGEPPVTAPPAPAPADTFERAPELPPSQSSDWMNGIAGRESQAGVATLVAVRTGRQEGFDRIVFEFGPGAPPGYHVSYIDRPVRACGSGDVVPFPGDGWLEMRLVPARAHTEEGRPTITERSRTLALPNLKQLTLTCDFEAMVTWVGGVLSPNDFRVLTLGNPTRLVVDIRHR